MGNKIKNAFEPIKASDKMKNSTIRYLQQVRTTQSPKPIAHTWQRSFAVACAMLFIVIGIGGLYTVRTPVSYVSIDVNPSIELALNRYDRVVSATAYNEDGTSVLAGLNINGMLYTQAIDVILESDAMQPYLAEDSALTFTVASGNTDKETEIITGIENCHGCSKHGGVSYTADVSSLSEAHGYGMSFGKYAAYLTLSQYDNTITTEDCHDMTMGEIHRQINAYESEGEHRNNGIYQNGGDDNGHETNNSDSSKSSNEYEGHDSNHNSTNSNHNGKMFGNEKEDNHQ